CGFLAIFFANCVKRTCHTSVCLRPFSLLSRKNMLKNPYISDTKQALKEAPSGTNQTPGGAFCMFFVELREFENGIIIDVRLSAGE
ncbi:MAG: hypothetical protein IJU51_00755, partial [Clostridia bacterium]|nr:hypothetical protein [Clostridia bacterium]